MYYKEKKKERKTYGDGWTDGWRAITDIVRYSHVHRKETERKICE